MRGGEKVLEVIADHFPEAPIYTLFHFPGSVSAKLEAHPIRTSYLQRAPGLRKHYRKYLPLFPRAIETLDLTSFDFILSTSHCVAKGVRPGPNARHICYCHTPMRYAWDQETAYFPKQTGLVAHARRYLLSRLRAWDVATAPRVHQFVANSNFVADRIRRYYQRSAKVIHPPIDLDFFTPGPPSTRGNHCLVVAALAPYKRIDLAIEACRRLELELRIVGEGSQRNQLQALGGERCKFLGHLSDTQLRDEYRAAACVLQPGVEDFGMSAVEALACGTPVVGLGHGGLCDVVVDGRHGVLYFEEKDVGALTRAIDKSRQIGFNELNLTGRAEQFATQRFRERLQTLLGPSLSSDER